MNNQLKTSLVIVSSLVLSACTTPGKRTAIGAGIGAATGAIAGAVIGHQSGDRDKGAAIGAGVGAILGGGVGNILDKQAKELEALAETRRTEDGIVTTLKNNILFDSGSAQLKGAATDNINQISDIIKKYPEDHIIVVGFTDDKGSDSYNQQLSLQRAQAVRLAMVARGVPASSVESLGQGESNPVAPNDTDVNRAKNRRVELNISIDPAKVQQ